MDWIQVTFLALIQGLTEFLPISSSAHLILPSIVLGWQDQGLAFDVAVHVGTLVAVMWYFRQDLRQMFCAWCGSAFRKQHCRDSYMAWAVIVATIPAGLTGLVLGGFIELHLRSALVIAITTLLFGVLLWWSDKNGRQNRGESEMNFRDAVWIGLAQALALVPGTSRSGITITAGLMLGLTRQAAARFSFLLSIPLILTAGVMKAIELYQVGSEAQVSHTLVGGLIAFVSALACIHLFLRLLDRIGMLPFVLYRMVLGIALIVFVV